MQNLAPTIQSVASRLSVVALQKTKKKDVYRIRVLTVVCSRGRHMPPETRASCPGPRPRGGRFLAPRAPAGIPEHEENALARRWRHTTSLAVAAAVAVAVVVVFEVGNLTRMQLRCSPAQGFIMEGLRRVDRTRKRRGSRRWDGGVERTRDAAAAAMTPVIFVYLEPIKPVTSRHLVTSDFGGGDAT